MIGREGRVQLKVAGNASKSPVLQARLPKKRKTQNISKYALLCTRTWWLFSTPALCYFVTRTFYRVIFPSIQFYGPALEKLFSTLNHLSAGVEKKPPILPRESRIANSTSTDFQSPALWRMINIENAKTCSSEANKSSSQRAKSQ